MSAQAFFLVPAAVDDRLRVSGGNVYDLRLHEGLAAAEWDIGMLRVGDGAQALAVTLASLPDGAVAMIDGLLVGREPDAVVRHATRIHVVVLAHMVAPELSDRERDALRAAERIVATSQWTRAELISRDAADPRTVVVAHPGTDAAPAAEPSASGGRLLCVAALAPHKGQDLLVTALAQAGGVADWSCVFAGSLATAPEFAAALQGLVASAGLLDRVTFAGVLTGRALDEAYANADLVVLPSRSESYGMALAEASARGIPILATRVGGIAEAIGTVEAAMIVPPDDAWALGVALRQWWTDPRRRRRMREAAMDARGAATTWTATSATVAEVLMEARSAAHPAAAHAGSAVRS